MTDVLDLGAEGRWTAWKIENARLEAIRASRMRKLFTTAGVAAILWLLWSL